MDFIPGCCRVSRECSTVTTGPFALVELHTPPGSSGAVLSSDLALHLTCGLRKTYRRRLLLASELERTGLLLSPGLAFTDKHWFCNCCISSHFDCWEVLGQICIPCWQFCGTSLSGSHVCVVTLLLGLFSLHLEFHIYFYLVVLLIFLPAVSSFYGKKYK